jgi:hypothetical protein
MRYARRGPDDTRERSGRRRANCACISAGDVGKLRQQSPADAAPNLRGVCVMSRYVLRQTALTSANKGAVLAVILIGFALLILYTGTSSADTTEGPLSGWAEIGRLLAWIVFTPMILVMGLITGLAFRKAEPPMDWEVVALEGAHWIRRVGLPPGDPQTLPERRRATILPGPYLRVEGDGEDHVLLEDPQTSAPALLGLASELETAEPPPPIQPRDGRLELRLFAAQVRTPPLHLLVDGSSLVLSQDYSRCTVPLDHVGTLEVANGALQLSRIGGERLAIGRSLELPAPELYRLKALLEEVLAPRSPTALYR